MNMENCTDCTNNKFVVVKENKSSFRLINDSCLQVKKIKIDGCVINDGTKRCDWLFLIGKNPEIVKFVELKGSNVDHAIEQLSSTLKVLGHLYSKDNLKCYVVTTKAPKAAAGMQKLKKDFYRKHGVIIDFKGVKAEVKV